MTQAVEHYWLSVPGGAWFISAYDFLLEQLPKLTPSVWVEVGCFHGQSLAYLGVEVHNRQLPVTIHAVDNFAGWPGVAQGPPLKASFDHHTTPLLVLLGSRFLVHPVPSVEAAKDIPDNSCDVIWIDADHTEEAVTADIAAWWPKLKPGGWMGGDDWAFSGVRKAVGQAFPKGYGVGDGERLGAPWPWWIVQKD